MEAQKPGNGGGEVRKVHIVYFLSHKGRIEQPHLIRVHHLSRNGVRLRDVKRWLVELRGKDMPESFSWSYKRKYKAGYVWQDLLDEDLITPISDNEYVLKGSQISSITTNDVCCYGEKEVSKPNNSPPFEIDVKDLKILLAKQEQEKLSVNSSTKTSFEIEDLPSFGSETSTEDTPPKQQDQDYKFNGKIKHEDVKSHNNNKKAEVNSILEALLNKSKNGDKNKKGGSEKETNGSKVSPSSNSSFGTSSGSYPGLGATHMFLNLITCGIVDTDESAVTGIDRRRKSTNSVMNLSSGNKSNTGKVVKGDKFGGSERVSRSHWYTLEQQIRDKRNIEEPKMSCNNLNDQQSKNIKAIPAAYKFLNGPYCSQCGRQFNPEKLHTHMTSCRRYKSFAKANKC